MGLGRRRAVRAVGTVATIVVLAPALAQPAQAARNAAAGPRQQRLLVAQALSIGFAGQALQSQLRLILAATATRRSCTAVDGGGSTRPGLPTRSARVVHATDTLYVDGRCRHPFEKQSARFADTGTSVDIAATSTYFGPDGDPSGTFTSSVSVWTPRNGRLALAGIGTFQPSGTAQPAQYGLACSLPTSSAGSASCGVGVEQDVADLAASLAAVTPIELTLPGGAVSTPRNGHARRLTGAAGALWLALSGRDLAIGGSGTSLGASTVTGRSGGLQLFPPAGAAWTVADYRRHLALRLAVGTGRAVTGVLRGRTAPLASVALDRTGTGTITYAGAAPTSVVDWTPVD